MKEAGVSQKALIVSNTQPAEIISRMYDVDEKYAVGYDTDDIASRIAEFGKFMDVYDISWNDGRNTASLKNFFQAAV